MRWTEDDLARIQMRQAPKAKQPRVRNAQRTEVDGIVFDSKREAQRWHELQMEQKAGHISALRRQVRFPIVVNETLICEYVADFVYTRKGVREIADAKGFRTEVYRLKRKLMLACYGEEIVES